MPKVRVKPERELIRLFVSAYEDFAWADSDITYPEDERHGGIDALITRSDGQALAIEHTLIEPFVGEKSDLAEFEKADFQRIKDDKSLVVQGIGIEVYVPVGIVAHQSPAAREKIVNSIHSWIANNRLKLQDGEQKYTCEISGMKSVVLTVKQRKFGHMRSHPGSLLIGRQQIKSDVDQVIENALQKKLQKLVETSADQHLLLLERDKFNFFPELIFAEIERQRPSFPLLKKVDEIWHVETIFRHEGYIYFDLSDGDKSLATMSFENGFLVGLSRDGRPILF